MLKVVPNSYPWKLPHLEMIMLIKTLISFWQCQWPQRCEQNQQKLMTWPLIMPMTPYVAKSPHPLEILIMLMTTDDTDPKIYNQQYWWSVMTLTPKSTTDVNELWWLVTISATIKSLISNPSSLRDSNNINDHWWYWPQNPQLTMLMNIGDTDLEIHNQVQWVMMTSYNVDDTKIPNIQSLIPWRLQQCWW